MASRKVLQNPRGALEFDGEPFGSFRKGRQEAWDPILEKTGTFCQKSNLTFRYQVTVKDVVAKGGGGLMQFCRNSLFTMLASHYPDHTWTPWKFHQVPKRYWKEVANQKDCVERIGKELEVRSLEDWYGIKQSQLVASGGRGLLTYFSNSFPRMLTHLYPDHKWQLWKFLHTPRGFWGNSEELKNYVEYLAGKLRVEKLDDWYRVSLDHVERFGPTTSFKRHGGISKVLSQIYPKHTWDLKRLESPNLSKASQWRLRKSVEQLFPNTIVLEDYHQEGLLFSSGQKMQIDVYIPSMKLAFEYQGKQHFHSVHVFGPQEDIFFRDQQKRQTCAELGITLIEIPYWWDFELESLAGTVALKRPELGLLGDPIPTVE